MVIISKQKLLERFMNEPRRELLLKNILWPRYFGFLGGMTIPELANLIFKLGCVEALNLDGGVLQHW